MADMAAGWLYLVAVYDRSVYLCISVLCLAGCHVYVCVCAQECLVVHATKSVHVPGCALCICVFVHILFLCMCICARGRIYMCSIQVCDT
jgi:hypothetical protein